MTQVKVGDRVWNLPDQQWPQWVRRGWVPPNALVRSPRWTRGLWREADSLEVYHLYRPGQKPIVPEPVVSGVRRGPFGILRGPGPSVTELLIAANILIAGVLFLIWGLSEKLRTLLFAGWVPVLLLPIFFHASLTHLFSNMLVLLGGGAVVEEYYGRKRMLFLYIASGIFGGLLSLAREKVVLSVGASGAIMGMYGVALVFLLRERRNFSDRQKFKLRRVYIPFFILMVIPAILHADFYAHLGGFLGGVLLALFIPPLPDRVPRPGHIVESSGATRIS